MRRVVIADPAGDLLCVRLSTRAYWQNAFSFVDRPKVELVFNKLKEEGLDDLYVSGSFCREVIFRDSNVLDCRYNSIPLIAAGDEGPVSDVEKKLIHPAGDNASLFDRGNVKFRVKNRISRIFNPEDAVSFGIKCTSNYQVSPIELSLITKESLKKYET